MAAILTPVPSDSHPARSSRPELTLLQGGRAEAALAATYRRRRIAAAVVVLVLAVASLAAGRAAVRAVTPHAATGPTATAPAGAPTVQVRPGDTLWAIARRLHPNGDVRPLVDRLAALHGPGPLQPGERIAVPT